MRTLASALIVIGGVGLGLAGLVAAGVVGLMLAVCRACR